MSPSTVINEVSRLNAGVAPKIEEMERNNSQLERHIDDADSNWHDKVKERFFSGPITNVRQAHKSQIAAMNAVRHEFESCERQIFSMV